MSDGLSIRAPLALGVTALVMLLGGFGLWAVTARLDSAIVATGRVTLAVASHVVQHPDGGVVVQVAVHEGQAVSRGDLLVRLDGSALRSELRIVEDRLHDLSARTARLEAERDGLDHPRFPDHLTLAASRRPDLAALVDGQERLFHARRETDAETRAQFLRRIDQASAQDRGLAAQRAAVAKQLSLVEADLAIQTRLLDQGLAQRPAVMALRREAARLSGQLGEIDAARARAGDLAAEIALQLAALAAQRREAAAAELREIAPAVHELEERRRALSERIARLDLRAPVSGVVLGLATTPQAVIPPAATILTIVPRDGPFEVEVRLPPSAIAEIAPGLAVELVPSASAASSDQRLTGSLTRLSADVLADPQTGAEHYLARVTLDPLPPGHAALVPGMPVQVFLRTGRHTPMQYLLSPVTGFLDRALREG